MINIYTDGACSGNPGPGGYGVVALLDEKPIWTHEEHCEETTNNREELKAVIYAIEQVLDNNIKLDEVVIYSDSSYVVNTCNTWVFGWAANGWKNSKKEEVKNKDLVQILYNYLNTDFLHCQLSIKHIKGHNGTIGNEIADALASGNGAKFQRLMADFD